MYIRPDLRRANLRGLSLARVKLYGADLRKADLYRANLREANLSGATLSGADISNANLEGTRLPHATLNEANLQGANLKRACLEGIDLEGANLERADLGNVNVKQKDLTRTNLKGAKLKGAYLSEAQLSRADLRKADLRKADLREADLREADLGEIPPITIVLKGTDLSGANLSRANLSGANLSRAKLRGANLTGADLSGALIHDARLGGADLTRANLSRADLREAQLHSANLTEADLRGTYFSPEQKLEAFGGFLELALCIGVETATFSETDFLPRYLARAFEYAHTLTDFHAKEYGFYFVAAIDKIRALRRVCAEQEPPKQLIELVHTIAAELIVYLKKHPKALYQIRPRQFEELVAEILASYNWQVQLTPPTKDGGYDIFAISQDTGAGVTSSWIIECKKYRPENKVGVDIVRALYGVKCLLGATNALLATTSFFTGGAKKIKASCYDLKLKDYQAILEWINEYRPNPHGKVYIKDNKLVLPGEE
jgi:uncharacterized protein YjbI with pentapeptide repeats/HJR/Mrr/RecB family endonuclease